MDRELQWAKLRIKQRAITTSEAQRRDDAKTDHPGTSSFVVGGLAEPATMRQLRPL